MGWRELLFFHRVKNYLNIFSNILAIFPRILDIAKNSNKILDIFP
jgi:hypothetical protein